MVVSQIIIVKDVRSRVTVYVPHNEGEDDAIFMERASNALLTELDVALGYGELPSFAKFVGLFPRLVDFPRPLFVENDHIVRTVHFVPEQYDEARDKDRFWYADVDTNELVAYPIWRSGRMLSEAAGRPLQFYTLSGSLSRTPPDVPPWFDVEEPVYFVKRGPPSGRAFFAQGGSRRGSRRASRHGRRRSKSRSGKSRSRRHRRT